MVVELVILNRFHDNSKIIIREIRKLFTILAKTCHLQNFVSMNVATISLLGDQLKMLEVLMRGGGVFGIHLFTMTIFFVDHRIFGYMKSSMYGGILSHYELD